MSAEDTFVKLCEKRDFYDAGYRAAAKQFEEMFDKVGLDDAAMMIRATILFQYGEDE